MTNLQNYRVAQIESQQFKRGWTSVVYWDENNQSVVCVGAKTEDLSLAIARNFVDRCLDLEVA